MIHWSYFMKPENFDTANPIAKSIAEGMFAAMSSGRVGTMRQEMQKLLNALSDEGELFMELKVEVLTPIGVLHLSSTALSIGSDGMPRCQHTGPRFECYSLDGYLVMVPEDLCPRCQSEWKCKLGQDCPRCQTKMGTDCMRVIRKLERGRYECLRCSSGSVTKKKPTCGSCGFTPDPKFTIWE